MIQEIRINELYSHLYNSEFDKNKNDAGKSYEESLDRVETIPKNKIKTLFTDNLINRYKNLLISDHGMIPPNCRYIESVKHGHIFVIEEPPTIRTLFMELPLHNEIGELTEQGKLEEYGYKDFNVKPGINHFQLTLALPYVIFIFYIDNSYTRQCGQIFFRTSQMLGLSDYLLHTPLPNISSDHDICFGNNGQGKSTLEIIQQSIMTFWAAPFNTDYLFNYELYNKVPIIRNYLEWEYMTKTNPMFIYNTDWVILEKKSIFDQIKAIKNRYLLNGSKQERMFDNFKEVFTKPALVDKSEYINKIKIKNNLKYDISQGIPFVTDNCSLFLNIGDTIILNNGNIGYVESFIGDSLTNEIKYILIDLNGRKIHLKYTAKLDNYLKNNVIKQQLSQTAIMKNGMVIKIGDIIEFNETYKQIAYIRKSRGENKDIFELKIGNEFCFAHDIEGTILNTDRLTIGNMTFEKDVIYILLSSSTSTDRAINFGDQCTYKNVKLENPTYQEFPLEFRRMDGTDFIINSYHLTHQTLVKRDELSELPLVFRTGGILFELADESQRTEGGSIWKYKNQVLYNSRIFSFITENGIKNCINGDTFFIAGSDFDTTFNVGDKVIVANWDNPIDVLNIKVITKFEYDETENNLYFILKDNNDIITREIYINGDFFNILTGKIRKVVNHYNELYTGMKIKAKETKIVRFPKKDTNIIIAILSDTSTEPLVLCSNGCTLWYSTVIEKFELIDIKSKRWNRLKYEPLEMDKFTIQPGDIVKYHTDSTTRYLVYLDNRLRNLQMISLESYIGQGNDRVNTLYIPNLILDCIPLPRINKNMVNINSIRSYYNFHGGEIEESKETIFNFIDYKGVNNV